MKKPTKKPPKKKRLKLYVWYGVLTDYTDGIAFAMAYSKEHALRLINEADPLAIYAVLAAEPVVYRSPRGGTCWGGG